MTRRAWLRHPPRTLGQPPACPAGTRYTSRDRAWDAALPLTGDSGHTPVLCDRPECRGGWHLVTTTKASTR